MDVGSEHHLFKVWKTRPLHDLDGFHVQASILSVVNSDGELLQGPTAEHVEQFANVDWISNLALEDKTFDLQS